MELFKESGKFSIAYSKLAGEKEYYLGSAFGRFYVPPSASVRLTGFSVSGACVFVFCFVCVLRVLCVRCVFAVCARQRASFPLPPNNQHPKNKQQH